MYLTHQRIADSSSLVKAATTGRIYTDSKLGRERSVFHSADSDECNSLENTTSGDRRPLSVKAPT